MKKLIYSDYLEMLIPFQVKLKNGLYEWNELDLMYYHTEDEEQPSYDYESMMERKRKEG